MSDTRVLLLVRFKSALPLDEVMSVVNQRADQFRAFQGLEQKYYLHDPATGEFGGLYVWESPAALAEYSASELRKTVAAAYQVEGTPSVQAFPVVMTLREEDA